MFANLKNGQLVKRVFICQKRKRVCEAVLKLLWSEGYILGYTTDSNNINMLKIFLKYKHNKPVINSIKSISKPGRRIYLTNKQIWKIDSTKTFIIFSTNQGIKSVMDCKKLNLGGEPLAAVS
jgi:small subunit ribosomal protein S8